MLSTLRRAGALLAALALAVLGAVTTAAPALAAPPVPGTQACTDVVNLDSLVVTAKAALAAAPAGLPAVDLEKLEANVTAAVEDATVRLCTGGDTPTTTTPPATSTPAAPRDERDCTDFATRQDAQDFYDSVSTPTNRDPSRLDRDGDGVACEPTEGAGGLDPTDDDDSTADTGGSQVVDVPEGSASTGT